MGTGRKNRKRPCRVCRKWFQPDTRLGCRHRVHHRPGNDHALATEASGIRKCQRSMAIANSSLDTWPVQPLMSRGPACSFNENTEKIFRTARPAHRGRQECAPSEKTCRPTLARRGWRHGCTIPGHHPAPVAKSV